MTDETDFDAIMAKFTDGGNAETSGIDKLLALEKLRIEARERADAVAREDQRRDREEARRGEFMKMLLGLGTTILPALLNKGTDPAIIALISSRGNGSEELKNMMEMQRQQSASMLDSMKTALMGVMSVKDEMHKATMSELLEKVENGDGRESEGGVAGTLREIRLSLGALAGTGLLGGGPGAVQGAIAAPEPVASGPAVNPGAQGRPAGQPAPPARRPVEVVLQQLMAMQQGKVTKPKLARAAMGTVVLQDDELTALLLRDEEDTLARVMDYCQPYVIANPALMQWIVSPGVAEWVEAYVRDQLCPLIDELAGEDDAGDEGDGDGDGDAPAETGHEPELLTPANVAAATDATGGANKPAPARG